MSSPCTYIGMHVVLLARAPARAWSPEHHPTLVSGSKSSFKVVPVTVLMVTFIVPGPLSPTQRCKKCQGLRRGPG